MPAKAPAFLAWNEVFIILCSDEPRPTVHCPRSDVALGTDGHRRLTAADNRWRGARRREILRARSEFCRLFFDDSVSPDSAAGLSRYFLHFAIAARRHAS
jgi:hypothetical protein